MAKLKPMVGVDLGGTNINVGIVDERGAVIASSRVNKKTQAAQGNAVVLDRIADAVKESLEGAKLSVKQVAGIGIGAAGAVDPVRGVVLKGGNLQFTNLPLAAQVERRTGLKTFVENDVNAAVYGEWRLGAVKGVSDVLGVWLGTGVGGGLVLGGKLYGGGFLTAGEIGHMIMLPGAPIGRRTVEENCSRTAISDRLLALVASGHPSVLKDMIEREKEAIVAKAADDVKKKGKLTWQFESNKIMRSKMIAQAYEKGDELTTHVVNEAADMLGTVIAGMVTLLSLPHVVLGGGLTEALGEPFVKQVRKVVRERAFPPETRKVEVVGTALMDVAGICGAAMLARDMQAEASAVRPAPRAGKARVVRRQG